MKIKNILVSQPKPATSKSPYFDLAKKYDLNIDFRPFIKIESVKSKEFRKERIDITKRTAVIFTSRTAVDHFFRICEEMRINVPDDMKYFCVSEAIALYLQKYIIYRKRKIFFGTKKFDDLTGFIEKYRTEKFLLPSADKYKTEIPNKLDQMGIDYEIAILYKTVASNLSDLSNVNYDVLVFFSPSGIQSLFENFPDFKQNNIKIAAFGTSTANAVKKANLNLDIKAPMPEAPSMTMALDQFICKYEKEK